MGRRSWRTAASSPDRGRRGLLRLDQIAHAIAVTVVDGHILLAGDVLGVDGHAGRE